MSRPCSVCAHASIATIDSQLGEGRAARRVAADYGLSYDATVRHARNHVTREPRPPTLAGADPLDELVGALRDRALAGDPSAAREYRLSLAAQAAKRAVAPSYDVRTDPDWLRLREIMLAALRPYPEARQAIADAIRLALG